MNDEKEKEKEYFITRYSLIPDVQIDLESYSGTTKEAKFINWLNSFAQEKKKDIDCNGNHFALYCKCISNTCFLMVFAKELKDIVGQKTDDGIEDTPISNYKKCNILINTVNQWMIIEKCTDISQNIISQKNMTANVIAHFMKPKHLYFELGLISQKNDFWQYVCSHKDSLTDVIITLSSPNFLKGITSVNDFLKETNEAYNNTSVSIHLQNRDGRLNIDECNQFLRDAVRYSSAGCGKWTLKSSTNRKNYNNEDNPFIVRLPENISQLKESDKEKIYATFEHVKHIDPECVEE